MDTKKFNIHVQLALFALSILFVIVGGAWMPQTAAAQEQPVQQWAELVAAQNNDTPPPSGWTECDPERGGAQINCQGKADGRLAAFGYAGAPWGNPAAAYAHLVGATKPNGEGVFSHCTASMAAFWGGSDCYPIEKKIDLTSSADCSGWSVVAAVSVEGATISYDPAPNGSWSGEYADGQSVTVTVIATWLSGETVSDTVTIDRPDCRVRDLTLVGSADCEQWSVEAVVSVEGATVSFNPAPSGSWVGEFVDGQSVTVSATATWASGESVTRSVVIDRPDCRVPAGPSCDGGPGKLDVVAFFDFDGNGHLDAGEAEIFGDAWGVQVQANGLPYMDLRHDFLPEWTTVVPGTVITGASAVHPLIGEFVQTQVRVWVPDRSNVDGLDPFHFYPRGGQHGYWVPLSELNAEGRLLTQPCDDMIISIGLMPVPSAPPAELADSDAPVAALPCEEQGG